MEKTIVESHTRFNKVDWYGVNVELTIGGAGTIGSWLSLLLARTGSHTMLIYDDDKIELANLAGQLYSGDQVDRHKVQAIAETLANFTELEKFKVHTFRSRLDKDTYVSPVCFSCFDNMQARKDMFNSWKKNPDRRVFIDGRMTIESYEVYTVPKGREKDYEASLFDSSEIENEQICSLKNTSHTGAMIAARMTTAFTNFLTNEKLGMELRNVPFKFREEMQLQMIEQWK